MTLSGLRSCKTTGDHDQGQGLQAGNLRTGRPSGGNAAGAVSCRRDDVGPATWGGPGAAANTTARRRIFVIEGVSFVFSVKTVLLSSFVEGAIVYFVVKASCMGLHASRA